MTRSRWGLGSLAVIVAIAIAVFVLHRPARPPAVALQPAVDLATAHSGEIDITVPAVGRLGPSAGAQSRLAFALSGRIASIDVHVGDRVVANQPLATLDATTFVLADRQAGADAAAARAQAQGAAVDRTSTRLAVDRAALAREQRLYAAGIAARKDVDAANAQLAADRADAAGAVADIAAARAQMQSAAARAALAAQDVSNTVLRAPEGGIITAIYHHVGESVDPTVPVVAVTAGTAGTVTLDVAGSDLARIVPGDLVDLHPQDAATVTLGRVFGIAGAVDPITQSAQVLVHADANWGLPGSAVSAQVIVAHDRGILIPQAAIVADPQSGATLVFVQTHKADGTLTFEQRAIRVIFSNAAQAEVTGIRAGEQIAARGAFELLAPAAGGD